MLETKVYSRHEIMLMDKVPRLNMINTISGFKSASLIGTKSSKGQENLAIFSSIVHIGSNPPLLGFIMRPLTVPRHTYRNIKQTGWFTVNHIQKSFYKKAHQTSGKFEEDISEFEACGIEAEYSENCPAPYVKESSIKIGLTFEEEYNIQANGTILIIGAVQELKLPARVIESDGSVDLEAAGTLAISGLDSYHKTDRLSQESYVRLRK